MADRSLESYAHRAAKSVLLNWLRSAASEAGCDEYVSVAGISWRVNRNAPHFGVWEEYPVLASYAGIDPVWDETEARWKDRPPSYSEIVDLGWRPMTILDIAIQHKGRIAFAIEIRHKHPCNARKVGFLSDELTLIEIPSYWVLGQVGIPSEMPAEFYLT